MSFYSDASLALIPSGYKNGKVYSAVPTDGSGDLSFTRASNATRVASNGLIEKVRENLLLQSNSFDTTWTNVNSTETSGQAGYDGTNNAWLLDITGGTSSQRILQSISASGSLTLSVYAKVGTKNWTWLYCAGTPAVNAYFDLQNGALGTATNCTSKIEAVGNGYYRCSISFNTTITDARIYPATGDGNATQASGNILIQNAQLETGDIATDYIATTTTAVSVGPVSGLPRLDYLNSSCPRLLLEPQRSNLVLFSEQFDNAGWNKTNVSISANTTTAPDGTLTADTMTGNGINGVHFVLSTQIGGTARAFSVYAKKETNNFVQLYAGGDTSTWANFDLLNGTVGSFGATSTATIYSVGDGWYRCILYSTSTSATNVAINLVPLSTSERGAESTLTSSIFLWGAQLEAGAYATSYIPTLSTSVTRVADAASKTGISSLIGQTEGTLFLEITTTNDITSVSPIGISNGTGSNRVLLYVGSGVLNALVNVSGVTQVSIFTGAISANTSYKMAIAYKANDFAFYVNGVLVGTDTSGTVPACSRFSYDNGPGTTPFYGLNNQALLFKTRLTNAQLAELTTL